MNDNHAAELLFAKNLAVEARVIALKYYKTDLEFKTKSDASPVTIADEQINQLVIDKVKKHYAEHGILGEEQTWQADKSELWVCDPVDGTIAFSMGDPVSMFSIALVQDGVSVVAVTCDFVSGDMFWAVKGYGAFCNGKPISVNQRTLDKAWLVLPTNLQRLFESQDVYEALASATYQTNCIHGGVFKGMLIAQGLADGAFWPDSMHPWDAAAVKLIITEAGGKFTDSSGNDQRTDQTLRGGVIASSAAIHQELMDIINA